VSAYVGSSKNLKDLKADEFEEEGGLRVPLGFIPGDYSEPSDSEESD